MLRAVLVGLIRFYRRAVSPWTPAACRFHPTCSAYALEAIERHGVWKGGGLGVRRLLRCHPWGGSGYDPVPPAMHDPGLVPEHGDPEASPGYDVVEADGGSPRSGVAADEPSTTRPMHNP